MVENISHEEKIQRLVKLEDEGLLFRAVFEHTFQFMGVLSADGILLDANQAAMDFIDKDKSEVLGLYFWDTPWWAGDLPGQEKLKESVKKASEGNLVRFDAEHKAPDGQIIYVDFSITPVLDAHGKVILLFPEGRDISQRINAERSLQERETRNRAILETAPDGICTVTMGGIVESANSSLHKLLGYKPGELEGKAVAEFILDFQGDNLEEPKGESPLKTGERKLFGVGRETTAYSKNGKSIPVEIALSLLNLGRSRIFIAIIRDIRERKRSQQLQAHLAAIVEYSDDAILGIDL
ncbi:MAG: PAS domain S-box protein, partial [Candidatus Obscuribacterales bacterium]|nr:PAS domain S-box protein [Candidatus Obscuribacterales bacterium]